LAVLTKSLARLRADFNTRFPTRDKASDGWIGDYRHQQGTSGHNPDDTKGSKAEYSDPDAKAEVRAIDVDKDFRESGASMQDIVDAVLRTPADRNRLRYIIFNRRIWSASNGWKASAYHGSNPHDKHAHFSGDPADDENDKPWQSVLNYRRPAQPAQNEEEDLNGEQDERLKRVEDHVVAITNRLFAFMQMRHEAKFTIPNGQKTHIEPNLAGYAINDTLNILTGAANGVDQVSVHDKDGKLGLAGFDLDGERIAASVLAGLTPERLAEAIRQAGLTPEALAASIPTDVATQVADLLAARLAS
jgi:hypothetical protein